MSDVVKTVVRLDPVAEWLADIGIEPIGEPEGRWLRQCPDPNGLYEVWGRSEQIVLLKRAGLGMMFASHATVTVL